MSAIKETSVTESNSGQRLSLTRGVEIALKMVSLLSVSGGKLIFIGNGGSAAIASHQAIDFWKNGGIPALAFNDPTMLTCLSNDYGYENVFRVPIGMFADAGDLLIAISSSGRSKNVLNGVTAARVKQCYIITMSGFSAENPLRMMGDLNFYTPATSYGYCEITHLSICHCILEAVIHNHT